MSLPPAAADAAFAAVPPFGGPPDATLHVHTLGAFKVHRDGAEVEPAAWGRDKAIQLFQFLVTHRRRRLTKEHIVEQLWPGGDPETGDRDFKVALNAVHRALEPGRPPRAEPRFVRRFGQAYGLDPAALWIDAEALEAHVAAGNEALPGEPDRAVAAYRAAAALYVGDYLPERRYEDWASAEAERLQILALGAMTMLADLMVDRNPLESLHLTQRVLAIDPVWEDAWRIQMRAHAARGNRALALRAWDRCVEVMRREIGLAPLPVTRAVYEAIRDIGVDSADPSESPPAPVSSSAPSFPFSSPSPSVPAAKPLSLEEHEP